MKNKHTFFLMLLMRLMVLLILPMLSEANVNNDLNHFFDGLGMVSNTTAPHAYQGQQAGYYSGGSLYASSSR